METPKPKQIQELNKKEIWNTTACFLSFCALSLILSSMTLESSQKKELSAALFIVSFATSLITLVQRDNIQKQIKNLENPDSKV